jgi:TolB-like protein
MSFFSELKRRNVIKVAIAYAIAAWLLIQIVATTFPVLQLPQWAVTFVTALVLIGFPLALIFAWAFELTPEGIKLDKDVEQSESIRKFTGRRLDYAIIAILGVAVVYFAYDEFVFDAARKETADTGNISIDSATQNDNWASSIAVLPFVNMSADPDNEHFSDGLSEEILNLLAKIPELKVIGRTSSFSFKGKNEDLRTIGQILEVKTVLEGSVRKSGDRVRITAQLIDASDGSHMWSESYDRTMTDIFDIQDDVASAIIDALELHVGIVPSRGRPTDNQEAYALFLEARAANTAGKWRETEDLLHQAIDLDPNFAEAYELLAFTYWLLPGVLDAIEAQTLVREAASKAIAIDPDLPFAEVFYRGTQLGPKYRIGTLAALDKAIRAEPNNPWLLEAYVYLLTQSGYLEEALRWAERFVEVDPLSVLANSHLAATLYAVGRSDEAFAVMDFPYQANLDPVIWKWVLAGINLAENRDEAAIIPFETWLQQHDYPDPYWFRELVVAGRDEQAGLADLDRRIPEIIAAIPEGDLFEWEEEIMSLYLFFGHLDRHYELIFATEPTDATWHYAGIHAWRGIIFRRLGFTAHPGFIELARLLSIDDVWEKRGPPDFCEKSGDKWVCE